MPSPRLLALLAVVAFPALLGAQSSAIVDDGTFSITRRGAPVGREMFRILRAPAPGGQVFRAQGRSVVGDLKIDPVLGADSTGVPISYESLVSDKGAVVQRLQGRGRPGRFSVLSQTRNGESAREYVIENGAVLIDEEIFHQYFFVPLAAGSANVTVINPRTAQQGRFRLEDRGTENVEIAGASIRGRRYTLTGPDGDVRDVWVNERGLLLRVSIPQRGLVALRDDPPR